MECTLRDIKTEKPHITWVYLRSVEADCYHNNSLIAAARGTGKWVGLEVCWYDFSESQYGKNVCDRILSPMKTCIRRFYNEGHDILSAGDMRRALSERPVKGTSACVCEVDEAKITLEVNKIDGFSKLHNVQFEEKGILVWRSCGTERGKEISFDQLLRACPRERREVVLHATSPISVKFCQFKGSTPKLKKTNLFLFWFFPVGDRPPPVFLGFHQGNRLKISEMYEALTAMVLNRLL